MDRIIQVFPDTHLGRGHEGLTKIISDGKKPRKVKLGELFVFINKRRTMAKILGGEGTLFHIRPDSGQIEMKSIIELPKAIGIDGVLNYNKALELALKRE